MTKYGSRKFLITVGVIVFASLAFWAGKLTEGGFVDLLKWIVGLYGGANVGAVVANKLGLTVATK